MRSCRARRTAACVAVAALVALAAAACGDEEPRKFPGAFPGAHTDVSAEQAFHDYGITTPPKAKVVGYYAWSEDDEYPMAAILKTACADLINSAAAVT
jgi:hypothetical protein